VNDCDQTGMRNHWHFPSCHDLPLEGHSLTGMTTNHPRRWCFYGDVEEIDESQHAYYELFVRTRFDERVKVRLEHSYFHGFGDGDKNLAELIPGKSTVCIINAIRDPRETEGNIHFVKSDGNIASMIILFPFNMQDLIGKYDDMEVSYLCLGCLKCNRKLSRSQKTKKYTCPGCNMELYCSKECQESHLSTHFSLCQYMKKLQALRSEELVSDNELLRA
jgi:hypothetical protein